MMDFKYCPDCGSELIRCNLGDDIGVPWCDRCSRPWFPMFPVATISLVYNDRGEVLLLRQNYISKDFCNLVSGYVHPGENGEICARREILEETGLEIDSLQIVMTDWFEKKAMMMIGYIAHTPHNELKLSSEVDDAFWCDVAEIQDLLSPRPGSTSRKLAMYFIDHYDSFNIREN